MMTKSEKVHQLKVTLVGSRPSIWRRFQVDSGIKLEHLHQVLQIVMGWTDSHLHAFIISRQARRGARRELIPIDEADEESVRLRNLLQRPKDRLRYDYDFGDSWEHEILLEAVVAPSPGELYPKVLSGRGACPPEDVGGIWGYYDFLDAIGHPNHPEHERWLDWWGEDFDPKHFEAEAVNARLGRKPILAEPTR